MREIYLLNSNLYIYSDQLLINSSIKVSLQQVLKYIKDNGLQGEHSIGPETVKRCRCSERGIDHGLPAWKSSDLL